MVVLQMAYWTSENYKRIEFMKHEEKHSIVNSIALHFTSGMNKLKYTRKKSTHKLCITEWEKENRNRQPPTNVQAFMSERTWSTQCHAWKTRKFNRRTGGKNSKKELNWKKQKKKVRKTSVIWMRPTNSTHTHT